MEAQYAPDDVRVGDEIKATQTTRGEVIAIGLAVVVVRDKSGFTRTLLQKRVLTRKRKRSTKGDAA